MNSRNYWFLADSELQWARYHFTSGHYECFWQRYQRMWRYVWLCIKSFTGETYDAIRKCFQRSQ